jgi:hypothetical protein
LKSIAAISVVALAAFLFLSPLAVVAAGATVTVKTDQSSYSGAQSITVFGTVSPTPSSSSYIVINAKNPSGAVVLSGESSVSTTDGSYSESFVTGGSPNWVAGTYTVNATYSFNGVSGSGTTTFTYTPTSSSSGGSGISQQQYNDIIGNITVAEQEISTLQKDLAGNSSSLSNSIASLSSALSGLTSTVSNLQSSVTSLTSTVNSISSTVSTLGSQVSTAATDATNAANSVGTTQTYVLVVVVLAAITLVLELAILVRKIS